MPRTISSPEDFLSSSYSEKMHWGRDYACKLGVKGVLRIYWLKILFLFAEHLVLFNGATHNAQSPPQRSWFEPQQEHSHHPFFISNKSFKVHRCTKTCLATVLVQECFLRVVHWYGF